MPNNRIPKIPLAQTVVRICQSKSLVNIVISPGSRNAPLTIGFTENNFFKCYSVVDERCAAFFALGMAQKTGKPTILVCTSGSAILNYYPAIAEAFYSDIPLIVISADRPKEFIDIGDGQTIRQEFVLQNHVLFEANLSSSLKENRGEQLRNEEIINEAINTAIVEKGPVHINVPFYEPLYETVTEYTVDPELFDPEFPLNVIDADLQNKMRVQWNEAPRKMVLVGVNAPNEIPQQRIDLLLDDPSVLVLTESTSNINHPNKIGSIDQFISGLSAEQQAELQPTILLTFGGMVVSKKIKAFLREYSPSLHWHVDQKKANDTFGVLTAHIKMSPRRFFEDFMMQTAIAESDYQQFGLAIKADRKKSHDAFLAKAPFTDLIAFSHIINILPDSFQVHLGNSSTVRYAQLFAMKPGIAVFCNRGTSGIEGSTSTAIGSAVASDSPTVLITGDLSFFYDSNALWNNYIPSNFKIIVINNKGGGIFRILPGNEESSNFKTFFETQHTLSARQLCTMYKFGYTKVKDEFELGIALADLFKYQEKPQLLEVFTPTALNDRILIDYFDNLS